jgi:hypothetical protein
MHVKAKEKIYFCGKEVRDCERDRYNLNARNEKQFLLAFSVRGG